MTTTVFTAGALWFFTLGCSVVCILLPWLWPRRFWWSTLFAAATQIIGLMGLFAWTPFGRVPEFGYSWANDSFQISMRSGLFYLLPLVLGGIGFFMAFRQRQSSLRV